MMLITDARGLIQYHEHIRQETLGKSHFVGFVESPTMLLTSTSPLRKTNDWARAPLEVCCGCSSPVNAQLGALARIDLGEIGEFGVVGDGMPSASHKVAVEEYPQPLPSSSVSPKAVSTVKLHGKLHHEKLQEVNRRSSSRTYT